MSFFKTGRDSKSGQYIPVGPRGVSESGKTTAPDGHRSPVFRTITLPDGKKVSYMRKDAFDRAVDSIKKG